VSSVLPTSLRRVRFTMVSGRAGLGTGLASRAGRMGLSTSESGGKTERMEKEDSYMSMETSMMGSGLMIKLMESEFIST
jgi:hypothetical protein